MFDRFGRLWSVILVAAGLAAWPAGASASMVTEFAGGVTPGFTANGDPVEITSGPDGHIWFTEAAGDRVAYIDGNGVVHEFAAGTTPGFSPGTLPIEITTGPDGSLWFTESAIKTGLGRVSFGRGAADGIVSEFRAGATSGLSYDAAPSYITTGGDGKLWFTDAGGPRRVGRVNGPDAPTKAATLVSGSRSVTLNGEVTPNGKTVTDCHFDFGPSAKYGTKIRCAQSVGARTSPVAVSAGVGPLGPGGTYHYRLVARNVFGTGASGDRTFTTAPPQLSASAGLPSEVLR